MRGVRFPMGVSCEGQSCAFFAPFFQRELGMVGSKLMIAGSGSVKKEKK